MRLGKSTSKSYTIGYRRPPEKFRFRKGRSGNPTGKRKTTSQQLDLRTQLESELKKAFTIRRSNRVKTLSKGAAGIEQLVDQFAKGDRNARRDLFRLCEQLGVPLANRDALERALDDAFSAEDEALLADFVKRHGGQYPAGTDTAPGLSNQSPNLLSPPDDAAPLLEAPTENTKGGTSHE
jgi:hypothetical protein